MPNYEYHCPNCGTTFMKNVPIDQRNEPMGCPSCWDAKIAVRQFAAPGFKLVGKGFHCNDYPKGRK